MADEQKEEDGMMKINPHEFVMSHLRKIEKLSKTNIEKESAEKEIDALLTEMGPIFKKGRVHPDDFAADVVEVEGRKTGTTLLMFTTAAQSIKAMDMLVKYKASPNFDGNTGVTPLILASTRGYLTAVESLLLLKAEPNPRQAASWVRGDNALSAAIRAKQPDICALLLKYNADPNIADQRGNSPVKMAATVNSATIVDALIAAKGDVASRNKSRWDALNVAVMLDNPKIVESLLENKANPTRASQFVFNLVKSVPVKRLLNKYAAPYLKKLREKEAEKAAAQTGQVSGVKAVAKQQAAATKKPAVRRQRSASPRPASPGTTNKGFG